MKKIRAMGVCAMLLTVLGGIPVAMAQDAGKAPGTAFFSTIDDLPLMPGMTEQADAVVFDQPDGRVAEAMATVPLGTPGTQITAFYDQTLPQLGWQREGANSYVRDKERLTIAFGNVMGGPLPVRFAIQPR